MRSKSRAPERGFANPLALLGPAAFALLYLLAAHAPAATLSYNGSPAQLAGAALALQAQALPQSSAAASAPSISAGTTTIVNEYSSITQPVIERIVAASSSGASPSWVQAQLAQMQSDLEARIDSVSLANSQSLVGAYQAASYAPHAPAASPAASVAAAWGTLAGTLADQTDLASALDTKFSLVDWYATTTDGLPQGAANKYFTAAAGQSFLDTLDKGYFFSTTSASYFLDQQDLASFSTTSAQYFLGENQPLAFSTSSASYFLSQNEGLAFATTSSDYWLSAKSTDDLAEGANLYFTPTRAIEALTGQNVSLFSNDAGYLTSLAGAASSTLLTDNNTFAGNSTFNNTIAGSISGNAGTVTNGVYTTTFGTLFDNRLSATTSLPNLSLPYAQLTGAPSIPTAVSQLANDSGFVTSSFSTTSAAYWQSQTNFFSTTSVAYWQSQTNFFSTTSSQYFLLQNQSAAFSTSSSQYFLGQNQGLAFSTSSASYFLSQNPTSSSTPTVGFITATSTSATSTFAGGFAAGGAGLVYNWTSGFVGVGTPGPARLFNVFGASANPQERISYSASAYTELQTDAAGDYLIAPTSGIVEVGNGNLEVCSNSVCATPTIAISGNGNFSVANRLVAGSLEETCPTGYIWVPGEAKQGTLPGFCTMKYVASQSGSTPVSTPGGTPWVNISQTSAIADCQALGPGYHLMSDQEWMTIADEITALPINDLTGSQQFATGHSDNAPANALSAGDAGTDPVVSGCNLMKPLSDASNAYVASSCELRGNGSGGSTDADKGYYGTGNYWSQSWTDGSGGKNELRTAVLPDGAVIWDIGGNVWQWTNAYEYGANESPTPAGSWYDYSAITTYRGLNYIRPEISTWNAASNGIGQIYTYANSAFYAFIRGGIWGNGSFAGPFALNLGYAPSYTSSYVGFRCSR